MSTQLAAHVVEDPDQMALFADGWTPLRKPFADAFRDVCKFVADANEGWVDPNGVRALLLHRPDYSPRQLSALWSSACGRNGYMDKTAVLVPISGEGSKGNTNKNVPLRFWRGWHA